MIEDYSRDLLRTGIIELKAGNRDGARRYIDRALYMSGDHDVMAEAWYWMSRLVDDPTEKRRALENCLTNDLRHARARRDLAILDGKLRPEDIVDADAPVPPGSRAPAPVADAQRFMCPQCGGRMHFAPDGQSLVCDYCTGTLSLAHSGAPRPAAPEKDFLIAMATVRGRGKPLAEQVFHCQGCGAVFILAPQALSLICPYCTSPHVVSFEKSGDLLAPDGIIPQAIDESQAKAAVRVFLSRQQEPRASAASRHRYSPAPAVIDFRPPSGLYLPLWTFDIGGTIDYTGETVEQEHGIVGGHMPSVVHIEDSYPVLLSHLPIPASRKLSAPFIGLLPSFDLAAVRPYDPRYLADWPAELYDIPMADASLDARSQAFSSLKRSMTARLSPMRLVSISSSNLVIESFRLVLVPVWMTQVVTDTGQHIVLVNGQNGQVYANLGTKPTHSGIIASWLSDLINE